MMARTDHKGQEPAERAWLEGDPEGSNTFIGEAVGLIRSIEPAGEVLQRMAREAEHLLSGGGNTPPPPS